MVSVRHFAGSKVQGRSHRSFRVNAITPGSIDTPAATDVLASSEVGAQRKKMIPRVVPLGRFGAPDEVAKAVVFLASEDSTYVTGAELFVDGGFAQSVSPTLVPTQSGTRRDGSELFTDDGSEADSE